MAAFGLALQKLANGFVNAGELRFTFDLPKATGEFPL